MSSGDVTQLFIAPLSGVRACDSAQIHWGYEGRATEDDVSILRIYTATTNDPEYQTIHLNVGTEFRTHTWPSVAVPPGMYQLFMRDDDSGVNATSSSFEVLPPTKNKSCYARTLITSPVPGPNSNSNGQQVTGSSPSSGDDEAAPKSQTIIPSVVVPVVVLLALALIILVLYRRRGHDWTKLRSRLPGVAAPGKEKRRRKKDKVSVALPSAPQSAAARQTSARQLNETDLGPYGFVSEEYPMNDRPHRRSKPSSFRAPRANEGSRKDFMLYDSASEEEDEDLKLMPVETPTEGRILPAYSSGGYHDHCDEEEAGMDESRAHLFTRRDRGYGDAEGYGELPRSSFALRPPTSAVTRMHHHEAHTGAAPSAQPRPRRL